MFKKQRSTVALAGLASFLLLLSGCSGAQTTIEALPEADNAQVASAEPTPAQAPGRVWSPNIVPESEAVPNIVDAPVPDGMQVLPPVVVETAPAPAGPGIAVAAPGAPAVPAAPTPAPQVVPPPAVPAATGFPALQLQLNTVAGNEAEVQNYSQGINTCAGMMESILVRDPQAGASNHPITVSVENLNVNAQGNLRTAGVALTPSPATYNAAIASGDLALALDVALGNQYNVCTTFVHEALHTMSVVHVGQGLMSPTIQATTFFDGAIANELNKVGYQFVPEIQAQLDAGQRVLVADAIATYTNSNQGALLAQGV